MNAATKINRRRAMAHAASAVSFGAAATSLLAHRVSAKDQPSGAPLSVDILLDEPIGTIKPGLYGHFTEHIGGVIYDGIWVGPDSKVPNIDGIRRSLVEMVRRLGKTVIRWPGGCFADSYDWRDGIGPRAKRPRRFGRWQEDTESNQFGTHEFMQFCRLCSAEPYLAGNVGSGSVEQFQRWVEYCNAPAGRTSLADERGANGDRDPFRVRYWGVGNESWGCGGKFTPEDYCTEYRKFTEWVPGYGITPFLIAAGPNGNDLNWTRRFFKKWTDYARAPLHGWAAHYYAGTTGHALQFNVDQWYEMLGKANYMEQLIRDQWAAMGEFDRDHKVKLLVDEWGCWHPKGTEVNPHHLFEQMGCLRDALAAALTLDTFNRHAEKMEMANVAQLVSNLHSLFLADGDKFVATPNFHVFEMYKPHHGAMAVRIDAQAPSITYKTADGTRELFRLAGSASRTDKQITLTLVHSHAEQPAEVAIRLRGGRAVAATQTVLAHAKLNAHNTFDRPDEVTPKPAEARVEASGLRCTVPPASVSRLDIQLG